MSDTIIRADNLSKKYLISQQQQERYIALRDVITNRAKRLLNPLQNQKSKIKISNYEEFWALKDVSFEIKQGDRIGIIGRNGAGKSTLLKVLSRITEPTTGKIQIRGRVASLLEVGTGFHPELTGRENIYLNGAILGMSKVEIKQKFDEIVAFAEIEKFLDTPVKRYSSGMYVRLAFAVAAHLEPEVLVVDEVLAVGDAQFQKKCLGKMENIGRQGRTVLFVSHNIGALKALCKSGIVLDSGKVLCQGPINEVLLRYNSKRDQEISTCYISDSEKEHPFIKKIKLTQDDTDKNTFQMHLPIKVLCEFEDQGIKNLTLSIVVRNSQGEWIIHSSDEFSEFSYANCGKREFTFPANLLGEGNYYMMLALGVRNTGVLYQKIDDAVKFRVEFSGRLSDKTAGSSWRGYLAPGVIQWH